MKTFTLLAPFIACFSSWTMAHNLTVGQSVPASAVNKYGEIVIQDDKVVYEDWSSEQMLGKVRVIQAIAGRSKAKEMNAPLMTAITAAKFSPQQYQTTTIINQDDALWGTGSFVKSSAEDSKTDFPWSSIVLDADGVVAQDWQLEPESSAIIVQDKQGNVLFVKEGPLNDSEIQLVLSLVKDNL